MLKFQVKVIKILEHMLQQLIQTKETLPTEDNRYSKRPLACY